VKEYTISDVVSTDKELVKIDCSNLKSGMYFVYIPGNKAEKLIIN